MIRARKWWFKKRYEINTEKIEEYVKELGGELSEELIDCNVKILLEKEKEPKLLLEICDFNRKLVNNEEKIKENVAKEFGIPKEKIIIYWYENFRCV